MILMHSGIGQEAQLKEFGVSIGRSSQKMHLENRT